MATLTQVCDISTQNALADSMLCFCNTTSVWY